MAMDSEITLVIPAKDRPEQTKNLFESLIRAGIKCRIIVIDDCSETPIASLAGEYTDLNLSLVRNNKCIGPAASRNIGIKQSRTRFVAFTDNDVSVNSSWLPLLYRHIVGSPYDVAGVGGKVVDDGSNAVGKYSTRLELLNPYTENGRVLYLVTANCIFRREALMAVGGFNEEFKTPGGEDPEISFRLLKAGYRLEYCPQAMITHHYNKSWKAFFKTFVRYGAGCRKAMSALEVKEENDKLQIARQFY